MKKNIFIYGLLIVYFFVSNFILIPMKIAYFNELINPLLIGVLVGASILLSLGSGLRIVAKKEKFQKTNEKNKYIYK